ncbi:MAG: double-strand break repair helicase AddA, partial [Acetobacteraceae bacterium]|nr:double-strand break repair helicase AddA [Acetobacteraceae bacterium]
MLDTAQQRAIDEQLRASDPGVSAFVEASAGSGKTKLLIDRMLRLMLAGADPAKIQCLTFTKAAAAEMANRLQARLGEWAVAEEPALLRALAELRVPIGTETTSQARALFARVLDLPGGMRIGTIHAFCQSLLRRFPLEARITPHFALVEDTDARLTMERAREAVLAAAPPDAVAVVAGHAKAEQFGTLVSKLDEQRTRMAPLLDLPEAALAAAIRRTAGADAKSEAALLREAAAWPEQTLLRDALRVVEAEGSAAAKRVAEEMLDWLALSREQRAASWQSWHERWINEKLEGRPLNRLAGKPLVARHPALLDTFAAEQARLLALVPRIAAARCADATVALLRLARPILRGYEARKRELDQLDYGDLIARTGALLEEPGAAWVLYKLDGGIDHLLLDEVQDTAPEQWHIAHRLTDEFFAGLGARPHSSSDAEAPDRTFFAVGDPKQSIYSFQGADREEFKRSRDRLAERVDGSGQRWESVTLDVSFRSTVPVLALVDAVFADPVAANGVVDTPLHHFAERAGHAGRVELWPLTPVEKAGEIAPWTVPATNLGLASAPQRLADAIADWIAATLARGDRLPSQDRPIMAGDLLILVRRRGDFARNVVRALKARGVPVAGLDRLVLTEQAAVQDVLAACDAILLPGDDLAVGCVLTSPLGFLEQDSLLELAAGRGGTLWNALRDRAGERPEWQAARDFLAALARRADHVTPHALLAEMLGPLGGRARLLARLGPEAAEPLDELLGAALDYTRSHPPSLQGFVHWLRRSGATVKREAGSAGSAVRVMTVHGAKGLQAPIVILPDTTALPPEDEPFVWADDADSGLCVPLWAPRRSMGGPVWTGLRAADTARRMQEYNRLLYVALTRAEDRLIVCGWETRNAPKDETWYRLVAGGFAALEAQPDPEACLPWPGPVLAVAADQSRPPKTSAEAVDPAAAPLPSWAGSPGDWTPAAPPPEPALPSPLVPSRPGEVAFGPVPGTISPRLATRLDRRDAFRRGTLVHTMLQHLPSLPEADWEAAAATYLARQAIEPAEADALAAQTLGVLRHPALAPLFGPGSRAEQPLTGLVGETIITGTVDRMAVLPGRVLLADYKTGRDAPADVRSTPVLYLRQLAAYRAVLRGIYPAHEIDCALVWTAGPVIAVLPPDLLDAHAP